MAWASRSIARANFARATDYGRARRRPARPVRAGARFVRPVAVERRRRAAGVARARRRSPSAAASALLDERLDEEPGAVVLRLFLRPDHLLERRHPRDPLGQRVAGEGIELLDADDLRRPCRPPRRAPRSGRRRPCRCTAPAACVVVVRRRRRGRDRSRRKWLSPWKSAAFDTAQLVAQQRLGREDHQRLAEACGASGGAAGGR